MTLFPPFRSSARPMSMTHQCRLLPWIVASMIAVAALTILFHIPPMKDGGTSGFIIDTALITASVLTLLLLCCRSKSEAFEELTTHEAFEEHVARDEDATWITNVQASSDVKLVTYVSAFQANSYASKTSDTTVWYDVAPPGGRNNDFVFGPTRPHWKRELGFALGRTYMTGPLTMNVLPNSAEYTVFCLFQLSGLPNAGGSGTLLYIPANGQSQIGLQVNLSCLGACTGSSIKAAVHVLVGNQDPLLCNDTPISGAGENESFVMFDTHVRYLLSITRNHTTIRVNLFNVESSSAQCVPDNILNTTILDDALVYTNQQIIINGNHANGGTNAGLINGNIMAFGIFDGALKTSDESVMCAHYHNMFLLQDPLVIDAYKTSTQATKDVSCPYDQSTCDTCALVSKWTNPFHVSKGGVKCMNEINTFCTQNPTHTGCECWDTSNNAFVTEATRNACQSMKSLYSGNNTALCAEAVHIALDNAVREENKRQELESHVKIESHLSTQEKKNKSQLIRCAHGDHEFGPKDMSECVVCVVCGETSCEATIKQQHKRTLFQWFFGM